jgi:hypothetical protein
LAQPGADLARSARAAAVCHDENRTARGRTLQFNGGNGPSPIRRRQ